jgi:hypothetical protein
MSSSQIDELMQRSTFAFVGTVKMLHAATMADVPVTDSTAVVTVDEVLQAPPMFADLAGSDITVQLSSAQQVQEGEQATFFTSGWIYGTSVAVQEVGHVEGRADVGLAGELAAHGPATPQNRTARVQRHIDEADVVIAGTVTSISLPEQAPDRIITEHDPEWRAATIEVHAVEKGDLSESSITVFYSASDDVQWYTTPILEVGQAGIFVLNKREIPALQAERYVLLDPLDVYPPEQRDFIQALVSQSSG